MSLKVCYIKHKFCETSVQRRALWPNTFEKHCTFYIHEHSEGPRKSFGKGSCFSLFNMVFSTHLAMESFLWHTLLTFLWTGGLWSTFCEMLLSGTGPQTVQVHLWLQLFQPKPYCCSSLPSWPITWKGPTFIKWQSSIGWSPSLDSLWEQLPSFQFFCLQGNMIKELSQPREQLVFISGPMCTTHGRCH